MPKYRKIGLPIEALQYTGDNLDEILFKFPDLIIPVMATKDLMIDTFAGHELCNPGDYIIKTIADRFYPCQKEFFERHYQLVE